MLKELLTSTSPSSSSTVKEQEIFPQTDIKFSEISTITLGTITGNLYILGLLTLIPAFTLAWAGSAILLSNYSHNLGRLKFWFIISLPLVFYIVTIIPTVLNPSGKLTYYEENFISLRLINKLTVITGSVLFGVAFLAIGRNIQKQQQSHYNAVSQHTSNTSSGSNAVRYYMIISAYGVLTFANLIATPVDHTTWPPFGFAALFIHINSIIFA